jgi:hypothetical protein
MTHPMSRGHGRLVRRWAVLGTAATALALVTQQALAAPGASSVSTAKPKPHATATAHGGSRISPAIDGGDGGDDGMDNADLQDSQERNAPGIVMPGAYSAAFNQMLRLPHSAGRWQPVTNLSYNSDDPRYRDWDSDSSSGWGDVTGRVTGLAADDRGDVYAGGANGGVWRSTTGGGDWTPISQSLPSQSTGALALDDRGRLWLGTGEGSSAGDTYLGTGVYVLSNPRHGSFQRRDRVGGTELESTTITHLRFFDGRVWATTSRGLWSHSLNDLRAPWRLEFAPSPDYLPGHVKASDPSAYEMNIVTDVTPDPSDPAHVMVAAGWVAGAPYNGFYSNASGSYQRVTSGLGDINADPAHVGKVTFAAAADNSRLYATVQDASQISNASSSLAGIYVSADGSPYGPWHLIANSSTLMNANSALTGATYNPGVQSWYNQFLIVDPNDPMHLYAGLEEVYESHDGGATWQTVGPYWNLVFPCWSINPSEQTGTCSPTTHPDQHAVTFGSYQGKPYVFVGNDGGVYRRPLNGSVDSLGHATDWQSLNDGTIDTLQYYSVGVGADTQFGGFSVTGGLQDNGQSELRGVDTVMGENFGGDGGETYVDPTNGCNILQEYADMAIQLTQDCGQNVAQSAAQSTEYSIGPSDPNPQFVAPFAVDDKSPNTWVAGGEDVWVDTTGFASRDPSVWKNVFDLGQGHSATAVAVSGGKVYVGWCGPCNAKGFTHGIAVGNTDGTGWHQLTLPVDGTVANRYIGSFAVDPGNSDHLYMALSGYSQRWNPGPGSGVGHVYESWDGGVSWQDISANLPDIPANSIVTLPDGGLALGTDLGVFYRPAWSWFWENLGHGLPTNVTTQLTIGPDGNLYASTHGRGIWRIPVPQGW